MQVKVTDSWQSAVALKDGWKTDNTGGTADTKTEQSITYAGRLCLRGDQMKLD